MGYNKALEYLQNRRDKMMKTDYSDADFLVDLDVLINAFRYLSAPDEVKEAKSVVSIWTKEECERLVKERMRLAVIVEKVKTALKDLEGCPHCYDQYNALKDAVEGV